MTTHEAIKILRNTAWLGTNEDREKTEQAIEVVAEALDQEQKRGKWLDKRELYKTAVCSECLKVTMQEKWGVELRYYDYCPNCGARMESDEE